MTKSGPKDGTAFLPSFPFDSLIFFLPRNAVAMCQRHVPNLISFSITNTGSTNSNVESTVGHVGSHLLEFEFLRELLVELLQLSDELAAGFDDCGFGCDFAVGVDAELEGRKERVRDLVGGEGDVLHAVELVAEHVGEGVIFLVESEESGVCDLCGRVLDSLVLECDLSMV
jgi:hypothetical protein